MRLVRAAIVSMPALFLASACAKPDSSPGRVSSNPSSETEATATEDAAESAARTWLALVDARDYARSWAEAAALFKGAVDQATWQNRIDGVRTPLGRLVSRETRSRKHTKTVPGAPDGDYVILTFETRFEKKEHAIETVTPMKDPDGAWRVSGYYIQ